MALEDSRYSWYWDEAQGGGVWINLGWHGLKMIDWLLGPISKLKVWAKRGGQRPWQYTTDHTILAHLGLKSGARGKLFASAVYPATEILRVTAEKGYLYLTPQKLLVKIGSQSQIWVAPDSKQDWYRLQLMAAVKTINDDVDSMDLDLRVLGNLDQGISQLKGVHVSN